MRIRGNAYLSRTVGTNEPPTFKDRRGLRSIARKEVFIGNQPSTLRLHHAKVSGQWFEAGQLYDNRKRR